MRFLFALILSIPNFSFAVGVLLSTKDKPMVTGFNISVTPLTYLLPGSAQSCVNMITRSNESDIFVMRMAIPQLRVVWQGPGDIELTKIIIDIDDATLQNGHYTKILGQKEVNGIIYGRLETVVIHPISVFESSGCPIQVGAISFTPGQKRPAKMKAHVSLVGSRIQGINREVMTASDETILILPEL